MKLSWSQVAHLAETFAPLILAETPLASLAPFVAQGITIAQRSAEADGPMTNADKLSLAIAEIRNGVQATNAQAQREIINQPDADAAMAAAINAVVAVINLKHDTTKTVNALTEGIVLPKTGETSGQTPTPTSKPSN